VVALSSANAERFFRTARRVGVGRDQLINLVRSGVVLQEKQLEASLVARQCDLEDGPQELAYGGARGGGKSHWLLAQLAGDDCQRYPGLKCLMLRKVGSSGKEGFEDLLPKVISGLRYKYVPTSNLLGFPNGSRIKLGHFQNEKDVDKYIGIEYDVIGVEEATTLSLFKYEMIRSCCRSSKLGWRPRMYSTTNPGGIGHAWYKERFIEPSRAGQERDTRFVPATVFDNAFVNKEYRGILEGMTGWLKKAWLYGDWDIAAGQFFTTWSREHHVRPAYNRVPSHWRCWLAFDYGFKHYTVVYLMAKDGEGNIHYVGEHAEMRWLPEQHCEAIDAMLERFGVDRDRIETIVAGGDVFNTDRDASNVANDYAAFGYKLERANNSRALGAARLLRLLGDPRNGRPASLFVTESCPMLIAQMPTMIHDDKHPEVPKKIDADDDGRGGDDAYDAARYGAMYGSEGNRVDIVDDLLTR
jgi:phage terminase large subunit